MIETRNRKVIKKIAWRYYKSSKQRNIFVVLAVILSAFLMSSVFSLGSEFYEAFRQQQTAAEGTNRDIIVSNPTEEQIQIAKNLQQSEYVGLESKCAIAVKCNDKAITYRMVWKDGVNWNKQTKAAISEVTGEYPEANDEIMLSKWTLTELGYEKYEVGMEIPVTYSVKKIKYEKVFYLSGYYEDKSALLNPGSEQFLVSEEFYNGIVDETGSPTTELGITLRQKILTENQMDNIKEEFNLSKKQGFFYNEELIHIVTLLFIGMSMIVMLIMLCSYLLIYNILYISFSREVQTYGLLKTVGMTKTQMNKMLLYQVFGCILIGIPTGLLLGGFAAVKLLPQILKNMTGDMNFFVEGDVKPGTFVLTALLVVIAVLISSFKPIKMVGKLAPLDAMEYNPVTLNKNVKKGKRGGKPYRMALYNIVCNKRKSFLVFSSLFLGITIFMLVNIYTNSINGKDYVNAYMPYDAILSNQTRNDSGNMGNQIIDNQLLEQIQNVKGISDVEIVTSDTVTVEFDKKLFAGAYLKEFCEQWMSESYEDVLKQMESDPLNFYSCLIAVDDTQLKELSKELEFNIDDFHDGKICILQSEIPVEGAAGKNISFNLLDNESVHTLQIAGVVEDNLSSYSGIAPNIYVSDKVVHKYVNSPWMERLNIIYDESYNQATEKRLATVLGDTNITLSSRISMWENTEKSKEQLSILGNGLSILLAIIGLLNFVNVMVTNIYQRINDFAILNSIGMTKRQIQKMLVTEGVIYSAGTTILVLTLGMAVSLGGFMILKEPYMILHFPYVAVGVVLIILVLICVLLPLSIYRAEKK